MATDLFLISYSNRTVLFVQPRLNGLRRQLQCPQKLTSRTIQPWLNEKAKRIIRYAIIIRTPKYGNKHRTGQSDWFRCPSKSDGNNLQSVRTVIRLAEVQRVSGTSPSDPLERRYYQSFRPFSPFSEAEAHEDGEAARRYRGKQSYQDTFKGWETLDNPKIRNYHPIHD